jgi:hypothetical protein
VLYRNDTANGNHWLELKLVGTDSNRSGVGAKVHVLATIGGGPRWQMRELLAGTGYGGHDALEIHVGLGAATTVDSVVIEWPSGIRQALANLAADQIIVVTEPMASEVPEAAAQANDVALAIVAGTSASAPLRAIVTVARDASGSLEIFDAHGRRARPAHERAFRAGRTEIALDPEQALGAGIYWVRLQCDGETRVRRAVRLR